MLKNKRMLIFSILLLIFLTIGMVSASDNITSEMLQEDTASSSMDETSFQSIEETPSQSIEETPVVEEIKSVEKESSTAVEDIPSKINTKIESKKVTTYYKENSKLVSYLKDSNNKPIANKQVSISINDKIYNKNTDNNGKVVLKLNLKPGTYTATIKFAGDDKYSSSIANTVVTVKKSTLTITTKNFKTYFESGFFFKAKVINKITKNPVKGVKVAFKVLMKNNKYKIYYSTTDSKGVAILKKNLKVGSYKVVSEIKKNKNLNAKKSKATLTIKETAEMGCSSLYVQVSNTEAVGGFRRDATNAKNLHIVKYTLNGIPAVKQYKTNSYFFHMIAAANGWMAGTGGWDNPSINHAIEKLAGKMFKSGKIKKSYLKKIQGYERRLTIGHFSIKAPNGKYAIVWGSGIKMGKLKPGEFIDIPNARSMFRHGTYTHYDKNPSKAAIKIAATDSFGVNRRDATAFHWKATTTDGKTTASIDVRAANDNGRLVGKSTGHLKDNIYFKNKFISKNSLPKTPSSKLLGVHNLGNIDKLIKIRTTVKAPKVIAHHNESKSFKVTLKNKVTKNALRGIVLTLKIGEKKYFIKTKKNGVAKFKTKLLPIGNHKVIIYTDNVKYLVSAKSRIIIKE